ncbi:MarR family winged helix-turn-helix transcriptional regulator [Clostridium autoethanogenum]|uniref:MarR family transcriptional regulator n=1 Tax=Clostridium autoethanogenum DSM 10061 TaxID=1341692 RepID=A0ABM5NYR4_9CLOT|nr:MarR family transcriptional regulator [Clostridium autoethanogenum]AGY77775.1 MarR family transcriptional regulator [Clostridium autoethanogenum DSM 10061]ALU37910.1 Transcriptional regulator MarR family [Clostridium autoethanogenum DSM 10061]OVY49739.1 transcriptional repressor MprA [Clostridium autoethanogenum]
MDTYREIFLMEQTYATLFSLANKLQVRGDEYLGDLTSRQYMTMVAIAHLSEGKTTLNNIARKLGSTKQNVKQIVTVMQKKEYVDVVPNTEDRRAVNVIITEAGKQVLYQVSEKGILFMAQLFKDFSTEELETIWGMLKKLYRFDGEEQDGFEEDSNLKVDESQKDDAARILKEFENIRKNQRKERKNYEK